MDLSGRWRRWCGCDGESETEQRLGNDSPDERLKLIRGSPECRDVIDQRSTAHSRKHHLIRRDETSRELCRQWGSQTEAESVEATLDDAQDVIPKAREVFGYRPLHHHPKLTPEEDDGPHAVFERDLDRLIPGPAATLWMHDPEEKKPLRQHPPARPRTKHATAWCVWSSLPIPES